MTGLAQRQAELVAALVAGGDVPAGFDARLVGATRTALLRKRAGEVARAWPLLAASLGTEWPAAFVAWADGRPPAGALRDGWDFARTRDLDGAAAYELAAREVRWRYDGRLAPRRRRGIAVRTLGTHLLAGLLGRWLIPFPRAAERSPTKCHTNGQ